MYLGIDLVLHKDARQHTTKVLCANAASPGGIEGAEGAVNELSPVIPLQRSSCGQPLRVGDPSSPGGVYHAEELLRRDLVLLGCRKIEITGGAFCNGHGVEELLQRNVPGGANIHRVECQAVSLHAVAVKRCEGNHAVHGSPFQESMSTKTSDVGDALALELLHVFGSSHTHVSEPRVLTRLHRSGSAFRLCMQQTTQQVTSLGRQEGPARLGNLVRSCLASPMKQRAGPAPLHNRTQGEDVGWWTIWT
mmetsp:Transcript_36151/g.78968  ORF Transcript_36151/g.78968 Transcript_36151/m.78968 type:complete len:249 (-) Transcript_36151:851-1597(-)